MDAEELEKRLEYVKAHRMEVHLFGTRVDGLEVCIIHGEKRAPWGWKPPGSSVLDDWT